MRDYTEAKQWYKRASDQGNASGTNNLGFMYLLERRYDEAVRAFHLAAAGGSTDALYNLGSVYESGALHPYGHADFAMAHKYFREAATK